MTPRFKYLTVTHRRPAGVMHQPGWDGIDVPADADEASVLARLGSQGWELAGVVANPHDTERRYYFKMMMA